MRFTAVLPVAGLLLASCAATVSDPFAGATDARWQWPLPPDEPRIGLVRAFGRHQELFEETGFGRGLLRAVAGDVDSQMVRPYAIAVHPDGGLLVTDPGLSRVHFYDWPRGRYIQLGGDLPSGLPSPVGVAGLGDGSIIVADSRLCSIERFSVSGKHLGSWVHSDGLQRPAGMAVNPANGDVYVADVLGHRIDVFTPEGKLRQSIGSRGEGPGEFNGPTHLAFDAAGELLVADSMNFRVQRLKPDGTPISTYGEVGDVRGNFARPKGVVELAPGVFAAVEGLYDSLVLFDAGGNLLMTLGGSGSNPGQFWLPAGLAVDEPRHLLFVADSFNSRVQVFRLLDGPGTVAEIPSGAKP